MVFGLPSVGRNSEPAPIPPFSLKRSGVSTAEYGRRRPMPPYTKAASRRAEDRDPPARQARRSVSAIEPLTVDAAAGIAEDGPPRSRF